MTTESPSRTWSVTVLGDSSDARFAAVQEASQHWNVVFAELGLALRFGAVTSSSQRIPERVLQDLSATVVGRGRAIRPKELASITGDVVVALSTSADITSVGIDHRRFGGRALVILRPGDILPLSAPNVARNVAAHELGHVLGLRHNDRPGTLMCMPPAPCRPMSYRSERREFFPLTDEERRTLQRLWIR